MNTKVTLVLAVIAALVFGGAVYLFRTKPTTKQALLEKDRIIDIDRDEISKLIITNPDGEIVIAKQGDNWMLEKPVKGKASSSAITQLMTSFELLKSEDAIDVDGRIKQFDEFGLGQPAVRAKVVGKNGEKEIVFGKSTAIEGRSYAAITGQPKAYVVRNELPDQLKQKVEDFRDRRLTDLTAASVNRLVIKSAAGEIELKKDADHWELVKPLHTRANDSKINDIIAQVVNAQIAKFVSEQAADQAKYGLTEPQGTIELYTGDSDKPLVVSFGKNPEEEKNTIYAKVSSGDATYSVPVSAQDALASRPNDLRDRNLVRVNLDTVDRIQIQAGATSFTLSRKEEEWELKNGRQFTVPKTNVDALLAQLNNAQITGYVADTPAEAAKYGLDQPTTKITFSAFSSENTAEAPAGEQKIATITFGKVENNELYVRVEEDPFIFSVNPSVAQNIMTDPAQWQDKTVLTLKPEDVTSIRQERQGKDPVEVKRGEDQKWQIAAGTGELNNNGIESILASIKKLSAVRWVGSVVEEHGLQAPEYKLTITQNGEPKTFTVSIGVESPESMRYASITGKEGAFLISKPQYDNITLPLLNPKVEATPTPEGSPVASPTPAATPTPATP